MLLATWKPVSPDPCCYAYLQNLLKEPLKRNWYSVVDFTIRAKELNREVAKFKRVRFKPMLKSELSEWATSSNDVAISPITYRRRFKWYLSREKHKMEEENGKMKRRNRQWLRRRMDEQIYQVLSAEKSSSVLRPRKLLYRQSQPLVAVRIMANVIHIYY